MSTIEIFVTVFYYGSFLAFPYLVWVAYRLLKKRKLSPANKLAIVPGIMVLAVGALFLWARFIEPQFLTVKTTTINKLGMQADVLLVADMHLGVYKGQGYLERVVQRMNETPAQINVIAGDFIYGMTPAQLKTVFEPLSRLNRPTYFVLGNHDYDMAGVREQLTGIKSLVNIEQQVVDLGNFQLAGVGDHWRSIDLPHFLNQLADKPLIVVAHNPDSAILQDARRTSLVLSGHTHCGQLRIPILYKMVIPSNQGLDCNLEYVETKTGRLPVFITPGVGEMGFPMRLFNPPRMDLLQLRP